MSLCYFKDSEGRKSVRRLKPIRRHPSSASSWSFPPSTRPSFREALTQSQQHRDMPPYEPWHYPSSSYSHPTFSHPELSGRRVRNLDSDDDISLEPHPYRSRRASRARPTRPQSTPDYSSLIVSPQRRNFPIPTSMPSERLIPFAAAARQLNHTVRQAITFFDNFYGTFRETSDGLRFHAPEHLMNTI